MKTRAITGFFFTIVMLASVLLGPFVFSPFYLVLSILCLREFYGLIKQTGVKPNQAMGIINGVYLYIIFALITALIVCSSTCYSKANFMHNVPGCYSMLFILIPGFMIVFIAELFRRSASPFTNIAYTFLGIIFVVVPFTFFNALAYLSIAIGFNFHFPLAFLLMLWANDTGAYLVGVKFGRTKLFERHSPKKTWEGFFGGMIISAGVALILAHFYTEMAWIHWVVMALLISICGTTGDLIESMFKRSINVKDSGGILPGHGGLLDRFDGLFFAAPIVYAYLYLIINY